MNPLHLSGYGLELLEVRAQLKVRNRSHEASEYEIQGNSYSFPPRGCPYDSIIIEDGTGHITLQVLSWLSKHNIPILVQYMHLAAALHERVIPGHLAHLHSRLLLVLNSLAPCVGVRNCSIG